MQNEESSSRSSSSDSPENRFTPAELEFMRAMQAHKKRTGRMFPTWKEVLEVLIGLGYAKAEAA